MISEESMILNEAELDNLIKKHGPHSKLDLNKSAVSTSTYTAIANGHEVEAIVLVVDIRKSTVLMNESISKSIFAKQLDDLVSTFKTQVRYHNGWFDKFTGDGFICYWVYSVDSFYDQLFIALDFSHAVMKEFKELHIPLYLENMRNVPCGIGLSIGIDAGSCLITTIGGDLTVIGSPIVGAVRMVSAAEPYEITMNNFAGSHLMKNNLSGCGYISEELQFHIRKKNVVTKEYPTSQEAYVINFSGLAR